MIRGSRPSAVGPSRRLSMRMERNFRRENTRPFWPMRSCRKNTGPGESSLMATAMMGSRGRLTAIPMADSAMSMPRLSTTVR